MNFKLFFNSAEAYGKAEYAGSDEPITVITAIDITDKIFLFI
jgi:hypothetical protein